MGCKLKKAACNFIPMDLLAIVIIQDSTCIFTEKEL